MPHLSMQAAGIQLESQLEQIRTNTRLEDCLAQLQTAQANVLVREHKANMLETKLKEVQANLREVQQRLLQAQDQLCRAHIVSRSRPEGTARP
jgi:multidrug resistance efflux pump